MFLISNDEMNIKYNILFIVISCNEKAETKDSGPKHPKL